MLTVSGSVPVLDAAGPRRLHRDRRRGVGPGRGAAGRRPPPRAGRARRGGGCRAAALRRRAGHPLQLRALDRPVPPRAGRPAAADVAAGGRPVRAARAAGRRARRPAGPAPRRDAAQTRGAPTPTSTSPSTPPSARARVLELLDDPDAPLDHSVVTDPRARLEEARRHAAQRLASLTDDFDEVVAASLDTNADDEHDPEGATIAFERSQVGRPGAAGARAAGRARRGAGPGRGRQLRHLRALRSPGRRRAAGGPPRGAHLHRLCARLSRS